MATVHHGSPTISKRGQGLNFCWSKGQSRGYIQYMAPGFVLGDHIYIIIDTVGHSWAGSTITICGGPSQRDSTTLDVATKSIVCTMHAHAIKARFKSSDMHHYLITAVQLNNTIMYQSQNNTSMLADVKLYSTVMHLDRGTHDAQLIAMHWMHAWSLIV